MMSCEATLSAGRAKKIFSTVIYRRAGLQGPGARRSFNLKTCRKAKGKDKSANYLQLECFVWRYKLCNPTRWRWPCKDKSSGPVHLNAGFLPRSSVTCTFLISLRLLRTLEMSYRRRILAKNTKWKRIQYIHKMFFKRFVPDRHY